MAHQFDEGPEVAPLHYPEVSQNQHQGHLSQPHSSHAGSPPYGYQQPYQTAHSPVKNEQAFTPAGTSTIGSATAHGSPHAHNAQTDQTGRRSSGKGTICGCTILVFILSCIIALLSAAVIGLAAGTGVEASRANDATNKLAALSSSGGATKTTTAMVTATPTFNDIDKGCSNNPSKVSGTQYTANKLLGSLNFTITCNKDAVGNSIMGLWVADFDTCMDSCAAYTKYITGSYGTSSINSTCEAVSFIPLWVNKVNATNGQAPGSCYLKAAPQNSSTLSDPEIGTECHAAQLNTV